MNMTEWVKGLPQSKKPLPLLSFPCVSLLDVSVYALTHDAEKQAEGVKLVADRVNSAAAVTMMDLSVEAEAFGCELSSPENEVPTVVNTLIASEEDADALTVPEVGAARTGLYIEAARLAKEKVTDRPVFAGIIGPFSLAGRLMGVQETMMNCLVEPELVHTVLKKTAAFLKSYALAYKTAGLDGIVMAEPLAGLLSPSLEEEFSAPYVKEIVELVQDEGFIVVYHNCGDNTPLMTESLYANGAAVYHFGDSIRLNEMLEKMPSDRPVCGNISPSALFANGSKEEMENEVNKLLSLCSSYNNFVLSSGCDIPPSAKWENIDAFFNTAEKYYK